jgi:hypothetical protein
MTQTLTLVLVEKTDGSKKNVPLNLDASLKDIRATLTQSGFMTSGDGFLLRNAPIDASDESAVTLKQLVGDDGAKSLLIGTLTIGLDNPDKSVDIYKQLDDNHKLALFDSVEIYKGLTASAKGLTRTVKPSINPWHSDQLPTPSRPNFLTEVKVEESFNEVEQSITLSSVDKASMSLDTPYGGGESSFEYAKKSSTTSKEVRTYLTGKFWVNKVDLEVDLSNLHLVKDFEPQILAAVQVENEIDQYVNLINTLNERGYYIPQKFTLGGVLMSTQTTKISEYSQTEEEKTEFSVGFKVAIEGFGGKGDYSQSRGKETSSSTTSKYSNQSLTKKGGAAEANEYSDWAKSLNPVINWDVIKYTQLYPTLALLSNKRLLRYCLQLLEEYNTYPTVKDKQTVINIAKYVTQVEAILAKGGGGIG